MSCPRHFVPLFCGTASLALLLACSKFFLSKWTVFFLQNCSYISALRILQILRFLTVVLSLMHLFWVATRNSCCCSRAGLVQCTTQAATPTVADRYSMGHVITQIHERAFQTFDRAFTFLLNLQKLGQVFQKLGWLFWNKCSA